MLSTKVLQLVPALQKCFLKLSDNDHKQPATNGSGLSDTVGQFVLWTNCIVNIDPPQEQVWRSCNIVSHMAEWDSSVTSAVSLSATLRVCAIG